MHKLPHSFVWLLAAAMLTVSAHALQPALAAPPESKKKQKASDRSGPHPSLDPTFSIPISPLGFAPPAVFYLGHRVSQASLDFLDEDHLLFTFRVPGLIAREQPASSPAAKAGDVAANPKVRHIRALVLALPTGQVTAEALWTVHDSARYLWMLKGPHFLLRDRNAVLRGDAQLQLEPFLRFPGPVNYLELDPSQQLLVADTLEPPATGSVESTASTAAATIVTDGDTGAPASQMLLRILNMDTRTVKLFSRVSGSVHLPVDGEGYYEALRGRGSSWTISHDGFRGATSLLSQVDSSCSPPLDAVAPGVVLVTSCLPLGGFRLTVLTQDKRRLWETVVPPTHVWPVLDVAPGSGRFARATIETNHPVNASNPIDFEDIRDQTLQIYDLATGKVALTAPISPVLDAGGNFALSPSGNRVAVLNGGAIQIFDLPPAPPIPSSSKP